MYKVSNNNRQTNNNAQVQIKKAEKTQTIVVAFVDCFTSGLGSTVGCIFAVGGVTTKLTLDVELELTLLPVEVGTAVGLGGWARMVN